MKSQIDLAAEDLARRLGITPEEILDSCAARPSSNPRYLWRAKPMTNAEREWAISRALEWTEGFLAKNAGPMPEWKLIEILGEAYLMGWTDAKADGELMREDRR